MAASLARGCVCARKTLALRPASIYQTWTRTAFFRRGKDKDQEKQSVDTAPEDNQLLPAPSSTSIAARASTLRKREGLQTVRGYKPPTDVEDRVQRVVTDVCGNVDDWRAVKLDNNRTKFKVLERAMREFDHFVPNSQLLNIGSASDVLAFFSTAVHDTSRYEDLASLDLPPNLHIQLDPLRFDPETDTMFGGVSAFPDRPTIVSSLKFRRKYGKEK